MGSRLGPPTSLLEPLGEGGFGATSAFSAPSLLTRAMPSSSDSKSTEQIMSSGGQKSYGAMDGIQAFGLGQIDREIVLQSVGDDYLSIRQGRSTQSMASVSPARLTTSKSHKREDRGIGSTLERKDSSQTVPRPSINPNYTSYLDGPSSISPGISIPISNLERDTSTTLATTEDASAQKTSMSRAE